MGRAVAKTVSPPPPDILPENSPPTPVPTAKPPSNPVPAPSSSAISDLPDAPSVTAAQQQDVVVLGEASLKSTGKDNGKCNAWKALGIIYVDPTKVDEPRPPCAELVYPYQRFLSDNVAIPLTWQEKGYLALHATTDPGNIGTIIGISAITIAADSHSAYGPGLKGFGELAGVSLLQSATFQTFATFAVPSITHQDPRYYRMRGKPFTKRLLYSITRSYISRSDSGKSIPNYGILAAYPIVAELSNLYVPGIESDGASTAKRIMTGLALDPANNLINEFLPDVARHLNIRIVFVQQILNNIAATQGGFP
jgi:hypothetical protein